MSKLLIRHCFSEANNRENYGTPAFGNPEAPLTPEGREQAKELGSTLLSEYGLNIDSEPVAVSMLRRTQETAIVAGFRKLHIRPELNEEKGGLSDADVRQWLLQRRSPEATIKAARHLINQPPAENIWITHAYLIGTICSLLGVYTQARFHPRFGEIRQINL